MRRTTTAGMLVLVVLGLARLGFAQVSELGFHVYGLGSIPTGSFGATLCDQTKMTRRHGFALGDKIGLAGYGWGSGAELVTPVWFKGLHWIVGGQLIVNRLDAEPARRTFQRQLGDSVRLRLEFGHWLNIPVMTGFRYDYYFSPRLAVFGILEAGLNISRAPRKTAYVGSIKAEDTDYGFARDFGYQVGAGVLLNMTYTISVRYVNLSTPRYDGTRRLSEKVFPQIATREDSILGEERSISMVLVTLGVQFLR
ncbi:MAG: hypothetical protein ONB23_11630 [candidate division KSB1 bacterium]|nr:hypothetical protein [candidate division KSB1 bacterium]